MSKVVSPSVVSLFAGCGGLDLGFKKEGFDLVYSCDNDPSATSVYKQNVDSRVYVRDVTTDAFHSDVRDIGSCDVVLGGFPCQGFSKAGPKRESDKRNLLYLEMKSAIETLCPKVFVAENVDGLSQNFKGKLLEKIVSDFEMIGYTIKYRILDAVDFGIAQHRRRIFFVGVQNDFSNVSFNWPVETHSASNRNGESSLQKARDLLDDNCFDCTVKALTIRDAIYDIRELSKKIPDHNVSNKCSDDYRRIISHIGEGQKLCNVRFSNSSIYTWNIPEVFGEVDDVNIQILEIIGKNRRHKKYGNIPNGNPLLESVIKELGQLRDIKLRLKQLVEAGYLKEKNGGYDLKGAMFCSGLFKRPLWDEPSPTILTNFHNPRYFVHPSRNTPFSLRECARLQGFPDDFLFTKSNDIRELENGYKLVGNAVAPPLAQAIAKSIKQIFIKDIANYEITDNRRKYVGVAGRI